MLPFWPDYVTADGALAEVDPSSLLGAIGFGTPAAVPAAVPSLTLPMPQLGRETYVEVWRSRGTVTYGVNGSTRFAHDGEALFGVLATDDGPIDEAARHAYAEILHLARSHGYPNLLRVWNHVRDLNGGSGDSERYKRFCAGRYDAFAALDWPKQELPAASAVGMRGGELALSFLASRTGGLQIENPRQVSAYEYPRQYGPRSPSFSRATVARFDGEALLFISGTSSVIGHESRHVGNVGAQLDETLENLRLIVEASAAAIGMYGSLESLALVKTYVRHVADAPRIAARLAAAVPRARILYVESEICRSDLLLEIEAIGRF